MDGYSDKPGMYGGYGGPSELSPTQLVKLRDFYTGNRQLQNVLAPLEHQSFVKEFTQNNPLVSTAVMPYFIPGYTIAKSLNLPFARGTRSDPSLNEITSAYTGLGQGLLNVGQQKAEQLTSPIIKLLGLLGQ